MFVRIHRFGLILSRFAPQQKHYFFALIIDDLDHMVREFLPSTLCVRVWFAILHCQGGIQQEHSLVCPLGQVTVAGYFEVDLIVVH